MSSEMIQILVLAAIALFLVLRLRSVLGTRDGFEPGDQPQAPAPDMLSSPAEADPDGASDPEDDIPADIPPGSPVHAALMAMKAAEPGFSVTRFLRGARQAYEMIVIGYENGDLSEVRDFMSPEVAEGFEEAIARRREAGLTVEAEFVGLRDLRITDARFDPGTGVAEITLRFTAELTSVVRNAQGEVVEGEPGRIRRQTDHFTFERRMGSDDPNWTLVATGA
ncbi:MAG: preprotein translocase subunit Tim44 [Paracoccaceae bacterium]|nr:MAG: Tim44 domain-containing protein [Alphaproteobacteria bacterium]GIX12267.1 MAG: preprotein translocase subunit Tim44 [Paracoccaceae bacterium]